MAALEYLTSNSLISYPFKAGRAVNEGNAHNIEDDWFYDILFTSYSDDVRSVYISRVKKTVQGALELDFSNSENLSLLATVTVAANNLTNHFRNIDKSFASFSSSLFAVKLVFGSGLVVKSSFEQAYTPAEASLTNAAIVLNRPRLKTLTFEAYHFDFSVSAVPSIDEVMVYSYPEVPTLKPQYNSNFELTSINHVNLQVLRGTGAGLYDPCTPIGAIQDVYSLNFVTPNSSGSLFLNASNCYTANTLSSSNETLYGTYLDKYRTFEIHTGLGTTTVDTVHVGHSITFENFCKPKCPHENLNAYAHYLNRVTDGAKELDSLVTRSIETRGQGTSLLKVFTATAFCVTGDEVFARCSDPSDPFTFIECGESFLKHYHEGRTLQLYYSSLIVRNYTIVEVIDEYNVRLNSVPPPSQSASPISFRVLDNGVISNLNCAALTYNQNAENFLKIYYQVAYTTNESYNADGVYSTNLAVVVSVYNPSPTAAQIQVLFEPTILQRISSFKLRKADSISTINVPEIILNCREYASLETVFSIPCATAGGYLDISVLEKLGAVWTMVGDTYSLPEIVGSECPDTVTGGVSKFRVTQQTGASFSESIDLPVGTTSISDLFGNIPSWLSHSFVSGKLELSASASPSENTSQRYNLYFRSYGLSTTVTQLIIDYVATPEIIAPLASRFSLEYPLMLSKENIYTVDSPVFQVSATNMLILSADFDDDESTYFYTVSAGAPPVGLTFNTTTGSLTGQLSSGIDAGSTYQITVTATNPSGGASNPQVINLAVATEASPEIALISPPEDDIYTISNLDTYTVANPLVSFSVINTPIYSYTLEGDLPQGLSFDRGTGRITGRVTATLDGSSELFIYTENVYGQSNVVSLTITYTVYSKPSITYPGISEIIVAGVVDESTLASPLFTITALQAYGGSDNYEAGLTDATRNAYLIAGLPSGFTLDVYTGKVYGKLADAEIPANPSGEAYMLPYVLRLGAYNPVGSDNRTIFLNFYSSQTPVVNNILDGTTLNVTKGKTYTLSSPLFKFRAINSPSSFLVTGLPPGLSCATTGELIGTVSSSVEASTYAISITASNTYGVSPAVNCYIYVPVSLITPASGAVFSIAVGETQSDLVSVQVCPVDSEDLVTITTSILPEGFTYSDGTISGGSSYLGTYPIKITASTANYGTAISTIVLAVTPLSYTVSGTVLDGDSNPVEDVLIIDGRGHTAITDAEGKYSLAGLQPGGYNIVASNNTYSILPSYQKVQIDSSNYIGVDFVGELATRLVRGVIVDEEGEYVKGVIVSDGLHETATNSFGEYELYISGSDTKIITPRSTQYVFEPSSGSVPAGAEGLDGANFKAIASHIASAPTIISVTPGDAQLFIEFTAPTDEGLTAITNYQYSIDLGAHWLALSPEQTTSPIVISTGNTEEGVFPLDNGTVYDITLRAVNASGPGISAVSVKGTPAKPPGAPTILSHTPGPLGANVFFTPPIDDGGSLILYYEYSIDDGIIYTSTNRSSSPVAVTGLIAGETYDFILRAVNSLGEGSPSAVYSLVMATLPDPPTIISIVPGDTELLVDFDLPTITGEVALTNIGYSTDYGFSYTFLDPLTTASPITIPDLRNGTTYYVALRAVNAAGNYSNGSEVLSAIPTPLPEAPEDLVLTAGDGQLGVAFTGPTNAAVVIVNYKYQLNNGSWLPITPFKTGSPVVITGLTNGVEYSVKLKASIATGDGAASEAVLGTPAKLSSAPVVTGVTPGNTTLTVFFTKPLDLGGLPLQEYRYSVDGGATYATIEITDLSETTGSCFITGLTNGTSYSVFLKAKTAAGLGLVSNTLPGIPRTVPSAPLQLIIEPGNTTALLAFTPPANTGGSAITNYKYQLNDGLWIARSPASTAPAISFTNLINGKFYSVKLKAVNAAGDGAESSSASFTPATIPGAPIISNIHGADKRLQIIFTPPINDGGTFITSYEYSVDGGTSFLPARYLNAGIAEGDIQASNYIIVPDLLNGSIYSVVIRAINYMGWGPSSNSRTGSPVGAPPAPRLISVAGTPSGAIVAFAPPSANGGAVITNYAYSATIEDGIEIWQARTPAATTSPFTIPDLLSGVKYFIKIRAINSYGSGTESTTLALTPGAPTAPTITGVIGSDEELIINFTPPDNDGGLEVTDYLYSLDSGATYTSAAVTTSPISVKNLMNGTSYGVRLRALNSVGKSAPSAVVIATPTNLPSAPTITTVSPNEDSFLVFFTPPSNSAGSAIVDYKYSLDGKTFTSADTAISPISITNLAIGDTYSISIRATNHSGDGALSNVYKATAGAPGAPTIDFVTASSSSVEVAYTPPADGGSPLLNLEYSLNNAVTWTAVSPAISEGPLVLTTQLTAGIRYAIRIRALNSRGAGIASDEAHIAKGLSTAPEIASIQPADGSLVLQIRAPGNYTQNIVDYKYNVYISSDANNYVLSNASSSPINSLTIPGLTNGQLYNIKIAAVYSSGKESEPSPLKTATPGTAAAPTALTAIGGNQKLVVSFTSPVSTGGFNITNYSYDVWLASDTTHTENWQTLSPEKASSPITVTGLTNNSTYRVKIRAINQTGSGEASAEVVGTPKAEVPSAPVVSSISAGNEALIVSFTAPVTDGGKPITSYKYSVNNGVTKLTHEGLESPIEINNLTNGTKYAVILYAVNEVGIGLASNVLEGQPSAGITPSAPRITAVIPAPRQLSIGFNPPVNDNGSAVTRYQYRLNSGPWTTRTPEASLTSPIVLTGLASNVAYRLRLRAVNAAGAGASSAIALGTTPKTVPGAPEITAIEYYSGNADLGYLPHFYIYFKTPTDNGGSVITDYYVDLEDGFNHTADVVDQAGWYNYPPGVSGGKALISPDGLTGIVGIYDSAYDEYNLPFGSTYYLYAVMRLSAINAIGEGPPSPQAVWTEDPYGAPLTSPTDVVVSALSSTSILIEFTPPARNAGPSIIGYSYSLNNGLDYSAPVDAVQYGYTITVTGLNPGTAYEVKIKAYNGGTFAEASEMVRVTTSPEAPTAPTIFSIVGLDQQLIVHFSSPVIPGGVILDYEYSLDSGNYVSGGVLNSPIVISGTTNEVLHSVSVRAVNQVGAGAVSNTSTGLSGKPGEPTITSIKTSAGGGTLQVYFTPPISNGGSPISKYYYSIDNGATFTSTNSTINPIFISGLTNGQTYSVVIKAENSLYLGLPSQPASGTPIMIPGAPTITQVDVDTSKLGAIILYFTPPTDNGGSAITGYKYSINGGSTWIDSVVDAGNSININTPKIYGTMCRVLLRAVNAAGAGAYSKEVSSSPISAPAPPSLVLTQPSGALTSITATITPSFNGGAVITHYACYLSKNNQTSTTFYVEASSPSFTLPGTFNFGDFVTLYARSINFGVGGGSPIAITSGVSQDSIVQTIHVAPITFPDFSLAISGVQYMPEQKEVWVFGYVIMPTNQSNTYVGTTIKNMQPLATGLEYSLDGGTTYVQIFDALYDYTTQPFSRNVDHVAAHSYFSGITIKGLKIDTDYTLYFRAFNRNFRGTPITRTLGYVSKQPELVLAPVQASAAPQLLNNSWMSRSAPYDIIGNVPYSYNMVYVEILVDARETALVYSIDETVSGGSVVIGSNVQLPIPTTYLYSSTKPYLQITPTLGYMVAGETRSGKTMLRLVIIGLKEKSQTTLHLATKNSSGGTSPFTLVELKTRTTLFNGVTPPFIVDKPELTTWSGYPPKDASVIGLPSFNYKQADVSCNPFYSSNGQLVSGRTVKNITFIDLEMYLLPTDVSLLFRRVGETVWRSPIQDMNTPQNFIGDPDVSLVFLGCSAALSLAVSGGPLFAIRNNPFTTARMFIAIRYTNEEFIKNTANPLDFEFKAVWTNPNGGPLIFSEILTIGINNLDDFL
jgi:predicted phage tail protein